MVPRQTPGCLCVYVSKYQTPFLECPFSLCLWHDLAVASVGGDFLSVLTALSGEKLRLQSNRVLPQIEVSLCVTLWFSLELAAQRTLW